MKMKLVKEPELIYSKEVYWVEISVNGDFYFIRHIADDYSEEYEILDSNSERLSEDDIVYNSIMGFIEEEGMLWYKDSSIGEEFNI